MKGKRILAALLSAAMVFTGSGKVLAGEAGGGLGMPLYLLDADSSTGSDSESSNADSLCVRRGNAYYFSYTLKSGDADLIVYYGRAEDEVLIGDWDGNGIDSVCVRRGNTYYFKNDFSGGNADTVVYYGRSDDEVVVGDWDGDGIDTLAVRRGNIYYISNTIKSGNADNVVYYGKPTDTVLAGDWDGDGIDTLAVRRGNTYYISNIIKTGNADNTVYYGRAADEVLVGDWDGDGVDTLTVRRGNIYYICNTIKTGTADQEIYYGRVADEVYAGAWTATPAINNFTANEINFLVDYESDIIFTAEVYETSDPVGIYRDGIFIGYMHDDGLDGDDVQGDGIYSYEIITTAEEAATEIYYAECEDNVSESVTIQYFTMPSKQDADEASDVFTEISSIEAGYADEDGYVPEKLAQTVINDVADYIDILYEEGTVIDYEVNDDCIIYQMASGLLLVFSPAVQDVDSIGYDTSMTVITCQPCLTSYGNYTEDYIAWPEGITSPMDMPDEAAENITDDFSNYTFADSTDYDDSEVSLSVIQSFSPNQVILWHGHGGYSSWYHSFLLTGEDFDWSSWWWDAGYFLENVQGYFILNSSTGKVCITSKYINKYCGSMDNSFVYLAACNSGEDSVLSDAFLNKGAVAVVANSKTIKTLYNLTMEYTITSTMATVNSETGNYYTLSEALAVAKGTYGNDDRAYGGKGAAPTIFGGSEADNFRFGDYESGTMPGDAAEYDGHYYYVFDLSDSSLTGAAAFAAAQEYCESLGGHLATITSAEEDSFVFQTMKDQGYSNAYFGFSDETEKGTWVWVTGEEASYTNWASGEPNNQSGKEDYAMYYYKYSTGKWNDGTFDTTTFICEWE